MLYKGRFWGSPTSQTKIYYTTVPAPEDWTPIKYIDLSRKD